MSEIYCKGTGEPGTRCKYDDAWFRKNPDCKNPVLTSTMLGSDVIEIVKKGGIE